jgi:hypothetical protein
MIAWPWLSGGFKAPAEPALAINDLVAITTETQRLAAEELQKKDLTALNPADQAAVLALQKQIQETAKQLAEKAGGATARDALSALSQSASAAEELANRLGQTTEAWASAALIAALQQHTDTADLGDATAARDASLLSKSALTLAAQLRQPQLPAATLLRLTDAFTDSAQKAEAADRERTVGRPVGEAASALQRRQADIAAQHLESLAMQMQEVLKRESAQKQLQNLAQQLRNAGSQSRSDQTAGALEAMKPMAQSGSAQQAPANQVPQSQAASAPNPANLMPPGLGQQMQQMQMSNPTPSGSPQTGQQSPMTLSQSRAGPMQEGEGKQGANRPRLLAPIPGKPSDQQPSALLMMPGAPPNPSTAASIPLAGREAGTGTADLNAAPTQQSKATQSTMVTATASGDGPSSTRQVEGQVRDEAATRSSTQEALQQLQREEAALDDAALPPARREHIRRYFNELRKHFEP